MNLNSFDHASIIRKGLHLTLLCLGIILLLYGLRIQVKSLGASVAMIGFILQALDCKCDRQVTPKDKTLIGIALAIILGTTLIAGSLVVLHRIEPVTSRKEVPKTYLPELAK